MTDIVTEGFPQPFDPSYISFCQWLSTRAADPTAGPLATHFLANGFLPGVLDSSGNFQPAATGWGGASGGVNTGASRAWVTAAPGAAGQALRLPTFAALQISAAYYGPNVTASQYAAALAAWGG